MSAGIFKPFYYEAAIHAYNLFCNRKYWLFSKLSFKLRNMPRFTACKVKSDGWKFSVPDSASFLSTYKEIFVNQIYAFHSDAPCPRILDIGANIGLSVLYFKRLYPQAIITAYEADPVIFNYLKNNVHGNGFSDVKLVNKAVWDENTTLKFNSEGADGGRVALDNDDNIISVEAVDIRHILNENSYDFLKIDIEGAEERVFPACKDYLPSFKFVFVEYHSIVGKKQCLDTIISLLTEAGFRIHIQSDVSPSPFVTLRINSGFDLQLNIFGWKE